MNKNQKTGTWKIYAVLSMLFLFIVTGVAFITKIWVLTSIPAGFLFGVFLQKGDLCGSSAFSEVVMMKDYRKVFGLWVLIVVAMVGFTLLDIFRLVTLNPKPFLYLSYLVGGVIFGVGTVLAGGCISGCLYKSATGNLNSMAALTGMPIGILIVEFGPLNGFHQMMKKQVIKMSDGGVISLPEILGIPFWVLAIVFAILTIITVMVFRRKTAAEYSVKSSPVNAWQRIFTKPWKPWISGLAIGLLMIPSYLSSAASGRNYPLGVTHGVAQAELLIIDKNFNHVWQSSDVKSQTMKKQSENPRPGKKIVWWLVLLVSSLMIGSWVSGKMTGQIKLLPKPPDEVVIAFFGGFLVGVGAAFATGCVVGNIMSGWALMSVGTFLFGIVTVISNWITTYFYMMGGKIKS
ncbi:MAG: hypothetical protein A2161_17700 [Candidatus Schekmanbacteria bacterium RBG_13_48_7]|uniref:Uncharacterized protein n=1 Tax=Candidatus Schekmanbacteria bacterium RBG_13_48_7 TaxID=1817878 RepID=A0A1F7RS70_9BACT|nr:MAG: hypothetical protein A2161_17700 [Candidatus Schekmanbacteria bacterium RBG_13_48_7]